MPIVAMPDNTQVSFPDDMPADQIRSLIQSKFPDAVGGLSPGDSAAFTGVPQGAVDAARALHNSAASDDSLSRLDSIVRSIANGVTLGGANRIAAAASAKTGIAGTKGDYAGNLANEQQKSAEFSKMHPYQDMLGNGIGSAATMAALSPLAPVAAAVAPEALVNGASNLWNNSLVARSLMSGGVGGTLGGVYGALESPDLTNKSDTLAHAMPGALGGALIGAAAPAVAAGIGRLVNGPQSAEQAIASRVNITPQTAQQAQGLIEEGHRQGIPLTLDEAVGKANGGPTGLTRINRVVSNSSNSGPIMDAFYNQRPGQVASAGQKMMNEAAPDRMYAPAAGLQVQSGAQDIIKNTQGAINASEAPFYKGADSAVIPDEALKPIMDDPTAKAAFIQIKNRLLANPVASAKYTVQPSGAVSWPPELQKYADALQNQGLSASQIANTLSDVKVPQSAPSQGPQNTVGLLSDIRDALGERIDKLNQSVFPKTSKEAQKYGGAYHALDNILKSSSSDYAQAKSVGAAMRQADLAPLENSIIGKVAETPDLSQQANIVFSPKYYGQGEDAARLAGSLSSDNPKAADSLLYQRLQDAFDSATTKLQGRPNVMGAANFAKAVAGSSNTANTLEAYMRAQPNGDAKWNGVRKFLDIAEATGYKPPMGSNTTPDAELNRELGQNTLLNVAKDTVKSGGTIAMDVGRRLSDWATATRLGKNKEQVARILIDPRASKILERIGTLRDGDPTAKILAYRLTFLGNSAASGARKNNSN